MMRKVLLPATCVTVLFLGAVEAPAQAGGRILATSDVVIIRVLNQPDSIRLRAWSPTEPSTFPTWAGSRRRG